MFDKGAYLARLGLAAVPGGLEGLAALQGAQLAAIPFEDVEPFLGGVPDLSAEALWRKMVADHRGGYCFELNGLLGLALEAFGYRTRPLLGRVRQGAPNGGARTHLAWAVTLEGRDWLVDTGFGGPCPAGPLEMVHDREQTVAGETFRLITDPATGETVVQRWSRSTWFSLYGYDEAVVTPPDIEGANFLAARWPGAPFSANLILARRGPEDSASLRNRVFKRRGPEGGQSRILESRDELAEVMAEAFNLSLDAEILDAVWSRLEEREGEG